MRRLGLAGSNEPLSVLCLGAHSDDIEIGAGATILGWIEAAFASTSIGRCSVHGRRADEAYASATTFSWTPLARPSIWRRSRMASSPIRVPRSSAGSRRLKSRVAPGRHPVPLEG